MDATVFQVLSVTRHWFDYKLPTFLSAVSNLQKYVYEKGGLRAGDYGVFAAQIENGFLEQRFSDLTEYGIPRSAITKIAKRLRGEHSVEEVLTRLRRDGIEGFEFTKYELAKVKQAL